MALDFRSIWLVFLKAAVVVAFITGVYAMSIGDPRIKIFRHIALVICAFSIAGLLLGLFVGARTFGPVCGLGAVLLCGTAVSLMRVLSGSGGAFGLLLLFSIFLLAALPSFEYMKRTDVYVNDS